MLIFKMSEEQQPEPNLADAPKRSGPRRRGRRGGRGRHRPAAATPASGPPIENDSPPAPASVEPSKERFSAPREEEKNVSAISQAVTEVTRVVESLKQSLAQMEEVLELVELAERQKLGDEREIDSLRRALRRIHNPRGGHPHPEE